MSGVGITHLELNSAADWNLVTHRDDPTVLVCTQHSANEKVTATEFAAVFINHATSVKPRRNQRTLIVRQF